MKNIILLTIMFIALAVGLILGSYFVLSLIVKFYKLIFMFLL
jgi:hypothetical protein